MKKIFIMGGVLLVLSILSGVIISKAVTGEYKKKKVEWAENEALVGQQIILRNDTLTILSYNKLSDKFLIENKHSTLGHNMDMTPKGVKTLLIRE